MFGMVTRSRAFSTKALKVVNNVAKQQFVVALDNEKAVLRYEQDSDKIVWVRTDVPEHFKGKGVGKLLAEHAHQHALENGLSVTCKCHFLADYYEKNAQKYKELKIKMCLED